MGVNGIALATIIAEGITMSYLIYKVRKTKLWTGLRAFKYDSQVLKELLKHAPIGMTTAPTGCVHGTTVDCSPDHG